MLLRVTFSGMGVLPGITVEASETDMDFFTDFVHRMEDKYAHKYGLILVWRILFLMFWTL